MVGEACVGCPFIAVSISLVLIFKFIYQMRLGSAFGAFLDPVADKVGSSSLFRFSIMSLILLSSDMVQTLLINHRSFTTAYGCCYTDPTMHTTLGGFCVWSCSLASDSTFNSNYWQGGN